MLLKNRPVRAGAVLALLLLLIALGSAAIAAPLTGGNTLYLIDGVETPFLFDPVQRKDGQLLPREVFDALGLTLSRSGRSVTVRRGDEQVALTLGSTEAEVSGELIALAPAPITVNDRLLLPAGLLPELGFEVITDSGYVQIRDMTAGLAADPGWTELQWRQQQELRTIKGGMRSDDGRGYLDLEVTYLAPDLVASKHFPARYGQRIQYLDMMRRGTLFLVRASNQSGRSATLKPSSLMLVAPDGRQFDVREAIAYRGLISQPLAHGAVKSTILLFDRVPGHYPGVTLFADNNQGNFAYFRLNQ